ncbi:MAG: DUF3379 family protein [Gammaproteobacteria bacterium]|nr:DUF3379 family protein [Gammaproteobacteria bacterium]
MDDLEFRKNATINPGDQRPEFLEKSQKSPFNRRFVSDQLAFDQQLSNTLNIATPENLAERSILAQQLLQHKLQRTQQHRSWLLNGIAASVIVLISLTFSLQFMLPESINSSRLSQQIISHVQNDTHALNVRMDVPKSSIDTMLASYGGKLKGPIGKVSFLGHCIIGEHTGIHMVLDTRLGLVTVLILPAQTIKTNYSLNDAQYTGLVYPSRKGSIAILAEQPEPVKETRRQIDQNLNWII